jgi:Txe/YoeB family toxin of Txe-Axe toxin-antitoxin module
MTSFFYVAADGSRPVELFLDGCPSSVQNRITAVVVAVAEAPPHRFAGGGMWEAMHGDMKGWYEIRVDYQRRHYRVFCLLDTKAQGRGSLLVMVDGRDKARGTTISDREYQRVRVLGERYFATQPRPIA